MLRPYLLTLFAVLFILNSCTEQNPFHDRPFITSLGTIDANTIVITIQAGEMLPSQITDYREMDGDSVHIEYDRYYGFEKARVVYRNGTALGWLTGNNHDRLTTSQEFMGDTLDLVNVDDPQNYAITCGNQSFAPVKVSRKSKPNNWLEPSRKFLMEHKIYLEIPNTFKEGAIYTIDLGKVNTEEQTVDFQFTSLNTLNEAIHINSVGYKPGDEGKRAYLSAWKGNGGAVDFSDIDSFSIYYTAKNEKVFSGPVKLAVNTEDKEDMRRPKSFGKTNVYHLDFGKLRRSGNYKIVIDGLGASYPFAVNEHVWTVAMKTAMRGFYHIRANIPMGPPYTDYVRPEGYFPGKHVTVYQSTASILNTGDGLNALGTDIDNFGNLIAGKTEITDTLGWGGYHDAGDWDRRIQHLHPSRWHLELYELFPAYYKDLSWNIPESNNELPDIIDEAMFNIDFYRRLQTQEGGIRGGIEAAMHPVEGEVSWTESLDLFVYAPDMWSSFIYAGVSARLAYILQKIKPDLAEIYTESATRAMNWGEQDFQQWLVNDTIPNWPREVFAERCHAALEMYRLSGESKYEEMFMEYSYLANWNKEKSSSRFPKKEIPRDYEWDYLKEADRERRIQRDAFFLYTLLPDSLKKPGPANYARELVLMDGDSTLNFQEGNAYNLASADSRRGLMVSFFSVPMSISLCRAHFISRDDTYLTGISRSTNFGLGGGPNNQVYMSGINERSPKNLFHPDSRLSGQSLPEGLIPYAQFDTDGVEDVENMMWVYTWYLGDVNEPGLKDWPVYESFYDVYRWPMITEWTPMQSNGPNSYVWGYLAGLE